jgi:hypothetical protein
MACYCCQNNGGTRFETDGSFHMAQRFDGYCVVHQMFVRRITGGGNWLLRNVGDRSLNKGWSDAETCRKRQARAKASVLISGSS